MKKIHSEPDSRNALSTGDLVLVDNPTDSARNIKIPASNRESASTNTSTPAKGIAPISDTYPQDASEETTTGIDATNFCDTALYWFHFGFNIIPIIPGTKRPAVKWDFWLDGLSNKKIKSHWKDHPEHELGFIVGDDFIVLDADSPMAIAALAQLEETFDITPNLTVETAKGQHHYFKRTKGTLAKQDSHSTEKYPERIDVKAGRALALLPPSTGKVMGIDEAEHANELTEASQDFIDAVARHNGREAPREHVKAPSPRTPSSDISQATARLATMLKHLDPDCGYEDWTHVGMAIHQETGGNDDGLHTYNDWSSKGKKYPGDDKVRAKWHSFGNHTGTPVTIGTIIQMLSNMDLDWVELCAANEPQFERSDFMVIQPDKDPLVSPTISTNPVARFRLNETSVEPVNRPGYSGGPLV